METGKQYKFGKKYLIQSFMRGRLAYLKLIIENQLIVKNHKMTAGCLANKSFLQSGKVIAHICGSDQSKINFSIDTKSKP